MIVLTTSRCSWCWSHGRYPKKRGTKEYSWLKREMLVLCYKQKSVKGRHGAAGFGVCPAGFGTCFYPVLPHCALIPPFWNGNVYSVPLSVGSVMIYGRGDPGKFHGWWEAGGADNCAMQGELGYGEFYLLGIRRM